MTTSHSAAQESNSFHDSHSDSRRLWAPLIAGAVAGLSVDVTLFPVDTIKTRLQSPAGFLRSGGFSRLYAGLGSTVSGSAPGAALFFFTYETSKRVLGSATSASASGTTSHHQHQSAESACHLVSACLGESVACLVRVPVEVVKQRAQAYNSTSLAVLRQVLAQSGARGLYRGYASTLLREIPFSLVQFPLWEYLKRVVSEKSGDGGDRSTLLKPYQSMACGSAAGAVAAFLTTPLDVAKTTIMLSSGAVDQKTTATSGSRQYTSEYRQVLADIYSRRGVRGLFAGALPRVAWISVGGAIFLGGYDIVSGCL